MTRTTLSLMIALMILLALVAAFFVNFVVATQPSVGDWRRLLGFSSSEPQTVSLSRNEDLLLNDQLSLVRREIESRQEELDRLKADVELVRSELPGANVTIDELKWRLADLAAERDRLRPLEPEVNFLRRENAELRKQLEALSGADPLEVYMREVASSRRIALEELRDAITAEFPTLDVVVSAQADALRFQGEGLFSSGSRALVGNKKRMVERIAELLNEILPCYSLGIRARYQPSCNPGYGVIETLQIEGHTDDVGSEQLNAGLASDRAVSTYTAMVAKVPGLLAFTNLEGESILAVASYGESRPIASNTTAEGKATNRRIELRFVMTYPAKTRDIATIRNRLQDGQRAPDATQ